MSKSELDWILKLGKNVPIIAAACDLNGIWRGKRIRFNSLEKVIKEGIRIPLSASCVDIWGSDLEDSPYLFESGDADGYGLPTGIGPIPFFQIKKTLFFFHFGCLIIKRKFHQLIQGIFLIRYVINIKI